MAILSSRALISAAVLLAWAPLAARASAPPAEAPWDRPFNSDTSALVAAAAAVPAEPGEPAVILLSEVSYRYDEAGRETRTERLVYRIVSPAAHESWSVVSEEWSPWHQQKPEIRARVITPDGREHRLDPAVMAENGTGGGQADVFDDERVLRAPLPATGPGAVVEEEIVVRETAPFFDGGVVRYAPFSHPVPCRRARLTVDVPESLPLSWVARLLPAAPAREERAGGRRVVSFDYRELPETAEPEPGLPPDVPRVPYVAFATGASWGEIARRYSAIVDAAIRGSDVAALAAAAAGTSSQEEAVARVLARLADIRYTAVELGQGGIVPRTPEETLRRRFGDCKDKAVLLVAALRALDIPAYVALLSAGAGEPDVEPTLPGLGAFDHAIAVVPGSPPIWIDPTDPYARAGELPLADQGRYALIASPTATGLSRTPEAVSTDNRQLETRELTLADLGPARVRETSAYHGETERMMRSYYASLDRDQVKKELTDYATEAYLAEELTRYDVSAPGKLGEPFRIALELAEARRGLTDMQEAAVALSPSELLDQLPEELLPAEEEGDEQEGGEKPPALAHDYYFASPFSLEIVYRIVPPAGFVPRPLPPSARHALGPAALSEEYSAAPDGTVTAVLRFDSGKRRITPAEMAALSAEAARLGGAQPTLVLFEHAAEALVTAGRVREALAEMRKQSREAPGKALPRLHVARALLAGGMGEAARAEARAAIAAEPSSAAAHRTLGWILEHDEVGRRFGKGFDRAGALAAYRKAKALDPSDGVARGALAILLEHDGEGWRYTGDADLAAAIAEYEALRRELSEESLDDNLLVALWRAGRSAEVVKLAGELAPTDLRSHLRLAAVAATEGAGAALREIDRTYSSADRPAALANAAQNLLSVRRYPEAAALYGRLVQISTGVEEVAFLTDVLRRTVRHEEMALDPASPATPLRRMIGLAVGKDGKEIARLFVAHRGEAFGDGEELEKVRRGLVRSLRMKQAGDLSVDVAIDLGLAAMKESVAGNDMTGYRVVLEAEVGGVRQRVAAFVVRDGGELRIAGMSTVPETIADHAYHLLADGDLATARQWLDWTREEADAVPSPAGRRFAKVWTKGRQAEVAEARCAALLFSINRPDEERLRLLSACRDAAETAEDLPRRLVFEEALADLYASLSRFPEMLESSRRLAAARPDDEEAALLVDTALRRLERWDELRERAERRLAEEPDDMAMRLLLSDIAFATGDAARGYDILAALAESADPNPLVLNQVAWASLFRPQGDERALGWSRRAVALRQRQNAPSLHTLAALSAEGGQTAEAYAALLEALAASGEAEPTPDDWYVFGRLAEQYDLPEVARGLYRKALPKATGESGPLSTRALAEARLAALGPEPKKPKP